VLCCFIIIPCWFTFVSFFVVVAPDSVFGGLENSIQLLGMLTSFLMRLLCVATFFFVFFWIFLLFVMLFLPQKTHWCDAFLIHVKSTCFHSAVFLLL